jgi:AcrR family transcriptional regulator
MILNMQSARASTIPDDRSTPARIRDAAIACFAEAGVDATSVRRVAETAEVSPALVIHHFGSKDALRSACDQHVAAVIRARKSAAVQAGPGLDPVAALRDQGDGPPLLAYLARTLTDGSPHVTELLDELVTDAVAYTAEAEASGMLRPSADPHARAAVLLLWSLGAVVLHEHARRLLGADLLGAPEQLLGYVRPAFEILGQGVFTPEAHAQMTAALAATDVADDRDREE